ncbi:MAG: hypothetical protein WA864_13410 [Acetobacteraceae bacterium]
MPRDPIGKGENPVITVARSPGEEAWGNPLVHGMEIAERIPSLLWFGPDEELLDDGCHFVLALIA